VGSGAARHAHATRYRTIGSPGTVTVCCVWATGRRCTVAALQPPLSTRFAGAWCLLVVRRLGRCAHSPKDDLATLGDILFTLIARRPLGLQGIRGCPGAASGWAAGAGAARHVAALELPQAGAAGHVATPELPRAGQRSWGRRTRGGPGAAPDSAVHAEVNHTRGRVICMSRLLS
jgi:hypothetical protein